jgi:hypothetical protein
MLRIVVPDIDIAIKAYYEKDFDFLKRKDNPSKMKFLQDKPICYLSSWFFTYRDDKKKNQRLIGGHVSVFNFDLIKYYLKNADFKNITKRKYDQCDPVFKGCDSSRYKNCSLYVECEK